MIANRLPFIVLIFVGVAALHGRIAVEQSDQNRIYASFLYKFGFHIRWPDDAFDGDNDPFVIGVLGNDPFGEHLSKMHDNELWKVNDRRVIIRIMDSMDQYERCHVLFISGEPKNTREARMDAVHDHAQVRKSPVLLVSGTPGFANRQKGVMINFVIQPGGRNRIEINVEKSRRAGLGIGSRLLNLSVVQRVTDPGQTDNSEVE